jgi:hypothetical protein
MTWWWARPLLMTAKGATVTLGSTVLSCALALQVEQSANQFFFYLMPHKYATVDKAYGLTQEQLLSVRRRQLAATETTNDITLQSAFAETLEPTNFKQNNHDDVRETRLGETIFETDRMNPQQPEPFTGGWQQEMIACRTS